MRGDRPMSPSTMTATCFLFSLRGDEVLLSSIVIEASVEERGRDVWLDKVCCLEKKLGLDSGQHMVQVGRSSGAGGLGIP